MTGGETPDSRARFAEAVADDLDMFAVLHAQELSAARIAQLRDAGFPNNLGLSLTQGDGVDALLLLEEAMRVLPEPPDTATLDRLAADYAAIYINNTLRAAPAESVWIDEEGLAYQQPMFQIRDWYRTHGLAAQDWRKRPDDHLVLQLQFVAWLLRRGTSGSSELEEIARFLDEHLLRWLTDFARRVAARCDTAFYAGLCLLTAAHVERLRDVLAQVTGVGRPTPEEIAARLNPARPAGQVDVPFVPGVAPSW